MYTRYKESNIKEGGKMDSVFALFDFMKESTWIETLMYTFGYQDFNPSNPDYHMLGEILFELHESSWSDQLHLYQPDIEEVGLKFLTVFDMRNIYLEQIIVNNSSLDSDVAHKIALRV